MRKTDRKIILLITSFVLAVIVASSGFSWFAGVSPVHGASKTVTAYGNARISTAQSKFGGASGLFDGNGDYLSTPASGDWYFGTGDFTIDFWVRFNALPGNMAVVSTWSGSVTGWHIEAVPNYYWRFESWVNNAPQFYFGSNQLSAWTIGTWYHVALVRSGNTWTWYQNGTPIGSTSNPVSVPDSTSPLWIGENENWRGRYLNGWLDELRISKGIARWTSAFTPLTSAYTADGYTVLLLHMDGADGSTTFTDSSPSAQTFNVRAEATKITATIILSSSGTVTISLSSPTTTYTEASMTVYEKTSGTQQGTTSYIKRAELPLSQSPTSQQTWSLVVSGAATYQWSIEVT